MRPPAADSSGSVVRSRIQDRGGAEKAALDEGFTVSTIARKNPDGSLSFEHVIGNENAARALAERQRTYAPGRKEDYHEK